MAGGMGPYDSTLQMFVQTPRQIDMSRLSFMRWLAEQGRLEHSVAGPPSGELVVLARMRETPVGGSSETEAVQKPQGEFMSRRISIEDARRRI